VPVFKHETGTQSADEELALAREAVEAGSGDEAIEALEEAFRTSKKKGETESLREVSELAQNLRANSSGSIARRAAELAYAASQNVRLLERRAQINAGLPSPISSGPNSHVMARRSVVEFIIALVLYLILAPIAAIVVYIGSAVGSSDPLTTWEVIFAFAVGAGAVGLLAYFTFKWWRAGREHVWVTPLLVIPIIAFWPLAFLLFFQRPRRWFTRAAT
jgi:hypothetical protein